MSRAHQFLKLYNQLDKKMRLLLNTNQHVSHAGLIGKLPEQDVVFRQFQSKLQAFRTLRNSLVHISYEDESIKPIAEPYESALNEYRMIVDYLMNPPTALEAIATVQVFCVGWDNKIVTALKFLDDTGFDTLPIIDSGNIVGMYTKAESVHSFVYLPFYDLDEVG